VKTRQRLAKYGAWLVAVLLVVAIVRRFDVRVIAQHMKEGNWAAMLPFALGLTVGYLLIGAFWDVLVFQRVLGGPRYVDQLRGRCGASLLMLLGYAAGHGAMGLWLARKTGASAAVVSGAVLYTMLSDLGGLGLVATLAIQIGHPAGIAPEVVHVAMAIAAVPIAIGLLAMPVLRGTTSRFLTAWRDLPPWMGILQLAAHTLNLALVSFVTWNAARAFGLTIPLAVFATYMPIIILATSLPFNIGGIGAAQAAWLVFLPWASGEHLLAFQLVWQFLYGGAILLRGLPFVRGVLRDIRRD